MTDDSQQALIELKRIGLINGNANLDSQSSENTPWYLQVFFGLNGVFASLLFLAFLTLILVETNILDSTAGIFIVGAVLSAAGGIMFHNEHIRQSPFWNGLAFAISGAGQVYIVIALFMEGIQPISLWLFLLIQIILTILMPNFVYRLLSSAIALGCLVYMLSYYGIPEFSLGLLALVVIVANLQRYSLLQRIPHKARFAAFDISKAVAYSSALVLLGVSVYFIVSESTYAFATYNEGFHYNYYLAQGLLTLASLYAAYLILSRYHIKILSAAGLIIISALAVLGVMSIYVSGLLATSLVIVIAMANSQRILLGAGVFALVGYVFWYYYQLDTSLLVKSISMLIIGISLLLMRWLLIKRYLADKTALSNRTTGNITNRSNDRSISQDISRKERP